MSGIRVPVQKRSQDSLDRVLAAGAELLSERGFEGFTLAEVSKRSGVAYGTMYWRVSSKDALLLAIQEQFLEEAGKSREKLTPEHWKDASLAATIEGAIRVVASVFEYDPGLLRALTLEAGSHDELMARASGGIQESGKDFTDLLAGRLAAAGHPDPARTSQETYTLVIGALAARLAWPEFNAGTDLSWDRSVDALIAMAIGRMESELPG